MSRVTDQYEAFPYPERDPKDEKKRLITGSPSHPFEVDHYLFGGQRDWSQPFRALVAGGGTGDGLIQLAQVLTAAKRPFEITYLDLSTAARQIAEERAKMRGLKNITFLTQSLLSAPDLGRFDYIDCCGVLHHLPEPQEGFDALAQALAPDGGLGVMVYAPFGRSGVYPLQEAFGKALVGSPKERLRKAHAIFERIPEGHPFKSNPNLRDHRASDAGFYDLLLHSQDRAYRISELLTALDRAGLRMTGSPQAHLYDPMPILGDPMLLHGMTDREKMDLAEALRGTIRTHVLYAAKTDSAAKAATPGPHSVPHLKGVSGKRLAQAAAKRGVIPIHHDGQKIEVPVPALAANALAQINGTRTLHEIAQVMRTDWLSLSAVWASLSGPLCDHGVLYYSGVLRKS